MRKNALILSAVLIVVGLSAGCDKSKEFAKMTDRVAGYVETGTDIVERQAAAGNISTAAQIEVLKTLQAINTINGEILVEAKKYQSADGKKLVLDGTGKENLLRIIGSGQSALQALMTNEQFLTIQPGRRVEIVAVISDLTETFSVMVELVDAVKTK